MPICVALSHTITIRIGETLRLKCDKMGEMVSWQQVFVKIIGLQHTSIPKYTIFPVNKASNSKNVECSCSWTDRLLYFISRLHSLEEIDFSHEAPVYWCLWMLLQQSPGQLDFREEPLYVFTHIHETPFLEESTYIYVNVINKRGIVNRAFVFWRKYSLIRV